jgi:hypothetical protein
MPAPTTTAHVCRIVETLWGEHWRQPASDALDIDVATLQRVRLADQAGEDCPETGDVLAALEEFTVRVLKMVAAAHATLED